MASVNEPFNTLYACMQDIFAVPFKARGMSYFLVHKVPVSVLAQVKSKLDCKTCVQRAATLMGLEDEEGLYLARVAKSPDFIAALARVAIVDPTYHDGIVAMVHWSKQREDNTSDVANVDILLCKSSSSLPSLLLGPAFSAPPFDNYRHWTVQYAEDARVLPNHVDMLKAYKLRFLDTVKTLSGADMYLHFPVFMDVLQTTERGHGVLYSAAHWAAGIMRSVDIFGRRYIGERASATIPHHACAFALATSSKDTVCTVWHQVNNTIFAALKKASGPEGLDSVKLVRLIDTMTDETTYLRPVSKPSEKQIKALGTFASQLCTTKWLHDTFPERVLWWKWVHMKTGLVQCIRGAGGAGLPTYSGLPITTLTRLKTLLEQLSYFGAAVSLTVDARMHNPAILATSTVPDKMLVTDCDGEPLPHLWAVWSKQTLDSPKWGSCGDAEEVTMVYNAPWNRLFFLLTKATWDRNEFGTGCFYPEFLKPAYHVHKKAFVALNSSNPATPMKIEDGGSDALAIGFMTMPSSVNPSKLVIPLRGTISGTPFYIEYC